jgi:NAD(P)-dependent dehydrogenase (short-subunit alcohol dehydrogenase family)
VVHSRSSASTGRALAESLGGSYRQADLAAPHDCAALVADVLATLGRLDVLVNNAGISPVIPHPELAAATPEVWRRILDVNLIAPWLLVTAAEAALRASPLGSVVNITSWAGERPAGASIPYAASKAALGHVTRLLAATLGPDVRVNAVAPGLVDTPLTATWTEAQDRWATRAPMRRAARPADVADLVSFAVHHDYLTGQVITLDGGMHLRT